jgi:uncharacterized coiled-coil DUF342 family protein
MKKLLGIFIVCMLLFVGHVYAKNDNTKGTQNKTVATQAREKRATIKANLTELKALRVQLRTKILATKTLLNQYRERTDLDLTDDEITDVKDQIEALKTTRATLGNEYGNIAREISEYKKDKSASKLSGLDKVIASQQLRISALKVAIAKY